MKRRVVVTGIGAISPLGRDPEIMWKNLLECKSGIKSIDIFDTSDVSSKIAGLIPLSEGGFNPDDYVHPSEQRKIDKFIVYALAAAHQAFEDAGFSCLSDEQKEKAAVIVGAGIGGLTRIYDTSVILNNEGARRVSPFFIPSVLANLSAGHIAIKYGFQGSNFSVVTACASGTHSIGEAFRLIQNGYSDHALAGSSECAVCKLGLSGFSSARALSTKFNDTPEKASRPWDKDRDGFVMGEGAGILALEDLESAQKRGARIYGELIGYGSSCDAFHVTAAPEDGKGAMLSMKRALLDAKIEKEAIDYINAHGTSTIVGDIAEINAIKGVFEDYARKVNVSSTKSAMGHLLGAAGSVESIICLLSMRDNVVPATLNLDNPADGCDINLTPKIPQERELNCVMNNSFGFGGTNASLIFKKM